MRLSQTQYAEALYELLKDGKEKEVLKRFQAYLTRRGEMKKWLGILRAVVEKAEQHEKILHLSVTTRFPLDESGKKIIAKHAKSLYPDKEFIWEYQVDEGVIGGFRLQTKDTRYDTTLREQLRQFSQTLT